MAEIYATYRPLYPEALFEFLRSISPSGGLAWDCGTGNGQAAVGLTKFFDAVHATDASENQISKCFPHPKIKYAVSPCEKVELATESVDLVTSAAAIHWFPFETFFPEVQRVLKPQGICAAWCYKESSVSSEIDPFMNELLHGILGRYFPPEVDKT